MEPCTDQVLSHVSCFYLFIKLQSGEPENTIHTELSSFQVCVPVSRNTLAGVALQTIYTLSSWLHLASILMVLDLQAEIKKKRELHRHTSADTDRGVRAP